jgi:Rieske Fe-S protein
MSDAPDQQQTGQQGQQRSRLDPEPTPRRDFLGLTALWSALGALAFAAVGMLRLPKAAVVASPSKKFRVDLPKNLSPGEAFEPPGHSVALFQDSDGVYAISTVCTHLGCIVKPTPEGFNCPCHGSKFDDDGAVLSGPAPSALPWLKVEMDGSTVLVDADETVPAGTKAKA